MVVNPVLFASDSLRSAHHFISSDKKAYKIEFQYGVKKNLKTAVDMSTK